MKAGRVVLKRIGAVVIIILCLMAYYPMAAALGESDEKIELSTDDASNRALSATHQVSKLSSSISTMRDQNDLSIQAGNGARDALNLYITMKPGEAADILIVSDVLSTPADKAAAQGRLLMLNGAKDGLIKMGFNMNVIDESIALGDSSIRLKEEYIHIVKAFDFSSMELECSIQNTSLNMSVVQNSIKVSTNSTYENILNLEDSLLLQERLSIIQEKKYSIVKSKYDDGKVSSLDREISESDYKKSILNTDTLKRNIENLYYSIKKQCGISLTYKVILKEYTIPSDIKLLSYEEYLSKALLNRNEIRAASNTMDLKQREFDITKGYVDSNTIEYREAEEALTESVFSYQDAVNKVTKDIKSGYSDAIKKQNAVELAKDKETSAKGVYEKVKKQYELGTIPETLLMDTEMSYNQAKSSTIKAERDYKNSLFRLDIASNVGPNYVMGVN